MSDLSRIRRRAAAMRRALDALDAALRESGVVRDATVEKAKAFVLAEVAARPSIHSTSALRRLARGRRLSNEAISRALDALQAEGKLRFNKGERHSRLWYVDEDRDNALRSLPGRATADEIGADVAEGEHTLSTPQNGTEADATVADAAAMHGASIDVA